MEKRAVLTKFLAVAGTILVWLPLLFPVLLSIIFLVRARIWRFDFLMPAELFPSFLLGSALLVWAAARAHSHIKLVAWGLGSAVLMLLGSQALAEVTGLASGRMEPSGLWWALVLILLAVCIACMLLVGVGGALLLKDLFKGRLSAA